MKARAVLLSVAIASVSVPSWGDTLTFGIVPQQSAKKLAKKWTPIFRYLSEKSGHTLRFSTAKDIPTFERRLAQGEYDLAYMNPYHYTVFHRAPGYMAFAKQKNKQIRGIVVVRKDSPIQSLTELADTTLAFPSPAAFAASVLPRARLTQDKIPFKPKYVSSHDSVYLNVAKGFFPAGGGVKRTFGNTSPEVRAQLRILWTTNPYTPHAFAAHPKVSEQTVKDVQQAMLSMNDDSEGQALLKTINFNGMVSAENNDWNDVRGLGLDILDKLIKQN